MQTSAATPTEKFLPFMREVTRYESALRELNLMWRLIESSAKMNCPEEARSILPMMSATREGFQQLETELVHSLVGESIGQVMAELGTSARHVIDIVVRNLYERTADVGFLATDQDLCRFVAGLDTDQGAVLMRLREYRNKYTVYDEILLLDCKGAVVAQIDEASPVEGTQDALLARTLKSDGFVESFGPSDLRPGKRHALLYSHRMLHPQTREPVGVLCLSFAFADEMQDIFRARGQGEQRQIPLLLDSGHRVIASGDPLWIPVGAQVPVNEAGAPALQVHAGRAYLVQTMAAAGYQGYPGPAGWRGQVMAPVDLAFSGEPSHVLDELEPGVGHGLLSHARHFCPPLHAIVNAADTIRRVVWNGQVMTGREHQDVVRLKAVLEQIGETGALTNEVFGRSIRDLYGTVLMSSMRDGELLTQLLVDLLDRNLYERANDCRWWALAPELRALLADDRPEARTPEGVADVQRILEHINGLYTVYARLMVYDRAGRIIASSRPTLDDGRTVVGMHIEQDTLAAVLAMKDTQSYHVTPWQASAFYGERSTYVYHAAVRAPGDEGAVVGGIGIVFNAGEEFEAMLRGALATKSRTRSFFLDRNGVVLSSADPQVPVGTSLSVPEDMLAVAGGRSLSRAVVHDGEYCIVACAASHGYREFKVCDGYREDVLALSVQSFGAQVPGALEAAQRRHATLLSEAGTGEGREMATFFIGESIFALPAAHVVEALPATQIARVSAAGLPCCMGTVPLRSNGKVLEYAWVFDVHELLTGRPGTRSAQSQVIVAQDGGTVVGLLVCELHSVVHFAAANVFPAPGLSGLNGTVVTELIKANGGRTLVQCLNVSRLVRLLRGTREPQTSLPVAA